MDKLRALEAFIKVAETSSITRAAHALGVSKSMVSNRLAALEHLTGEQLVARTTRSVVLTQAGRRVYEAYMPLVERLSQLGARPARTTALTGRLRVIAMIDVGMNEVAGALLDLQCTYPELQAELVLSDGSADPRTGGFDLAFNFRGTQGAGLTQETVSFFACGLFASPAYLEQGGALGMPADLAMHRCLGYSFQPGVDDWNASVWSFSDGASRTKVRVPLFARGNSSTLLKSAAEAGLGIAVLPVIRAAQAVEASRLVRVLPNWSPPSLTLTAVWARTPLGRSAGRELVAAVRARILSSGQGVLVA